MLLLLIVMIKVTQGRCAVEGEMTRDCSLHFTTDLRVAMVHVASLRASVRWKGVQPLYSLSQSHGRSRCSRHSVLDLEPILRGSVMLLSPRPPHGIVLSILAVYLTVIAVRVGILVIN